MPNTPAEIRAVHRSSDLETSIASVEQRLGDLAQALRQHDSDLVEARSADLHRVLVRAVDVARRATAQGGLSPALRRRLAMATGQVAAQRVALSRASSALDRAFDVLMPSDADAAVYGTSGQAESARSAGRLEA